MDLPRRATWTIGWALALLACASPRVDRSEPGPTVQAPILPAVVAAFAGHPLWFGRSEHSPFGPMPYALVARRDGEAVVLRGDVPPGLGLPDGSYQQFTLAPDAAASRLDYETSLAGPLATGRMIEAERSVEHARYCMAPEAGSCRAMEVLFRREGNGVRFETRRDGAPHHAVVLRPEKPR